MPARASPPPPCSPGPARGWAPGQLEAASRPDPRAGTGRQRRGADAACDAGLLLPDPAFCAACIRVSGVQTHLASEGESVSLHAHLLGVGGKLDTSFPGAPFHFPSRPGILWGPRFRSPSTLSILGKVALRWIRLMTPGFPPVCLRSVSQCRGSKSSRFREGALRS